MKVTIKGYDRASFRREAKVRAFRTGAAVAIVLAVSELAGPGSAQAQPSKLAVIVMENQPYSNIVGNPNAPYINSLIGSGKLFSNYWALKGGSLPDYLAMTSGLLATVSPPSRNVFQAIDGSAGAVTWKSFQESMGGNCGKQSGAKVPGTTVNLYARIHDPAYQYRGNTTCSTNDVSMTTATFTPAALPSFSYIVPNQCDDMHTLPPGGTACPAFYGPNAASSQVGMGDRWLQAVVPSLLAQPDVTVLLTWDEGNSTTKHVLTLEVGAGITPGSSDSTRYNHYGLEAGLYRKFNLGTAPNNGATATPLPTP
jgi:phosphatidylinositol-3-phosphatase